MNKRILVGALIVLGTRWAFADGATPAAPVAAPVPSPAPIALTSIVINEEGEHLLADSAGKTLYVFDLDKDKPAPVCNGDCAEVWPPTLLTDAESKALKAPLGFIVRANKKLQMTYAGRPVYNYAFDRGHAADAGDGVGNVWHYVVVE